MTSQASSQTHGLALFIDIENFINGCYSLGLGIELMPLRQRLQEIAPVRLSRAYGDIIKVMSKIHNAKGPDKVMANIIYLRQELSNNMVAIEDIPHKNEYKNSADMILSLAALDLAKENPSLTHFAFVSNDKDYIPLYLKLREMGRFIISIYVGADHNSNRIRDAVDTLIYFEDIVGKAIPRDLDQPNSTETETKNNALRDSFELLVRAFKSLESEGRTPVLVSLLVPKMQQIRADFDYARLGFSKFSDFVSAAKEAGYIELLNLDNRGPSSSWQIELPAQAKVSVPKPAATVIEELEKKGNPQEIVKVYTQTLEHCLKIRFPEAELRRRLLKACIESQDALPLHLQDFSNRVAEAATSEEEHFKATDDIQKIAFKMLLSLYYARAFSIEYPSGSDNYNTGHNPYLVSLIYQRVHELETRLEAHFAKTLKYHCKHLPRPEDLARLFYGDTASVKQVQHCEEIIYEIRYW